MGHSPETHHPEYSKFVKSDSLDMFSKFIKCLAKGFDIAGHLGAIVKCPVIIQNVRQRMGLLKWISRTLHDRLSRICWCSHTRPHPDNQLTFQNLSETSCLRPVSNEMHLLYVERWSCHCCRETWQCYSIIRSWRSWLKTASPKKKKLKITRDDILNKAQESFINYSLDDLIQK